MRLEIGFTCIIMQARRNVGHKGVEFVAVGKAHPIPTCGIVRIAVGGSVHGVPILPSRRSLGAAITSREPGSARCSVV